MLADHFEPAIVPHDGSARAAPSEQERRLESWCRTYPQVFGRWRDNEGRPFVHTYFYPAEQYDRSLIERLTNHTQAGWGEIEVHLHHGICEPDTEHNTRRQLRDFRDILAQRHGQLCYLDGRGSPRYAFVHGNFAVANSAGGRNCGVDSEMQILAETGCYAEMTLPPGPYHSTHIRKINSLYECARPLSRRGAHRSGTNLRVGRQPEVFPLVIEGPLTLDWGWRHRRWFPAVENGTIAAKTPPSLRRLRLWKQAGIKVQQRPDWLFIKLQCHGMDPRDCSAMLGAGIREFVRILVEDAKSRNDVIHFVSAREMVNIALAACDGREGNPGNYRDYRLKRLGVVSPQLASQAKQKIVVKG